MSKWNISLEKLWSAWNYGNFSIFHGLFSLNARQQSVCLDADGSYTFTVTALVMRLWYNRLNIRVQPVWRIGPMILNNDVNVITDTVYVIQNSVLFRMNWYDLTAPNSHWVSNVTSCYYWVKLCACFTKAYIRLICVKALLSLFDTMNENHVLLMCVMLQQTFTM